MFYALRLLATSGLCSHLSRVVAAALWIGLLAGCGGGGGGGGGGSAKPPLAIVAQPADVSVVDGSAATFSAAANEAATYQWQRQSGSDWVALAGATLASWTMPAARVQDDGARLRVLVTSVDGAVTLTSSAATLHVTAAPAPPAITLAPTDLSLVEGQGGSMSVTASGSSLSYQWQASSDGSTFADIAGATSATLVLETVVVADDGKRFRVVITNAQGVVTSPAARLAVTPAPVAPTFTTSPVGATVVVGSGATFTVAVSGVPVPTLAWQSSVDGATWTTLPGQTATRLVRPAVAMNDNGTRFRALATNPAGTVDSPAATLTVTPVPVAPSFGTQPAAASVGVGATPAFHVAASGTPAPGLQWQVSTDGGATFANIVGATGPDLTLAAVTMNDDGKQFRALAVNPSGSIASGAAVLTVRPPPHILQQPEAQAWRGGLPLPQFQMAAAGTGLSYRWQLSVGGGAWNDIVGATAAGITVTPPAADAAVRAIVTNAAGDSATTDAAALRRLRWAFFGTSPGNTMRDVAWLDANTLVAVGDAGTVARSTDAGLTWQLVRQTPGGSQDDLAGVAFASTSVGVAVGAGGRVLRTTDGGLHWSTVIDSNFGASFTPPMLSRVAFSDAMTVVAVGALGEVLRSTDAGQTWRPVDLGVTDAFTDVAFRNGVGILFSQATGVYRSINGGAQWTQVVAPAPTSGVRGDIAFATDALVAIATPSRELRSTDAGLTWQTISPAVFWNESTLAFKDASVGVALPNAQGGLAYTTGDGGLTWSQSLAWPGTAAIAPARGTQAGTSVRIGPGGIGIAAGTQGTLWRTIDGGQSWTEVDVSAVPQSADLNGVAFGSAGVGVAFGAYGDGALYRTSDGGAHWSAVGANVAPDSTHWWLRVRFSDANTVVALDSNGHTARSIDGGATWSAGGSLTSMPAADMAFASRDVGAVIGSQGLFTTADGGRTWVHQSQGPGGVGVAYASATTLVSLDGFGNVQRSVDGGVAWQTVFASVDFGDIGLRFGANGQGFTFGRLGRLLRTVDGGATWQDATIPEEQFTDGWFVPGSGSDFFLLSDRVWHTTDGGATWQVEDDPAMPRAGMAYGALRAGASFDSQTAVIVGAHGLVLRRSP